LQKSVVIQIGSYRLRDKVTGHFLPSKPLYKTVAPRVAEALAERAATLLVDCYNECEKLKNFDYDSKNNLFGNCVEPKIFVSHSQKNLSKVAVKTAIFEN